MHVGNWLITKSMQNFSLIAADVQRVAKAKRRVCWTCILSWYICIYRYICLRFSECIVQSLTNDWKGGKMGTKYIMTKTNSCWTAGATAVSRHGRVSWSGILIPRLIELLGRCFIIWADSTTFSTFSVGTSHCLDFALSRHLTYSSPDFITKNWYFDDTVKEIHNC